MAPTNYTDIIDLDKNIVSITLAAVESDESQTRVYNIETVSEDKIITEKKTKTELIILTS
mgnify:CR=1 FL=1